MVIRARIMKANRRMAGLLALALAMGADGLRADHFSGASITYTCIGGNNYNIFLDMYLDCSGAPITPQTLYFINSCGVEFSIGGLTPVLVQEEAPLCPAQISNSTCNGGTLPSFRKYRFQTTLYLSPCNYWNISWYICCRNTMQNVQLTPGLYAEASIDNLSGLCDASPKFVDTGIPYVCLNQLVQYNPGVSDADGHTMVFSLIAARFGTPAPVPVTYVPGYTGSQPMTGISINAFTGQLTFTPNLQGYFTVVIKVTSYTSGGVLIGSVMRDLMFAVIPCNDVPPVINALSNPTGGVPVASNSFYVCDGQSFCVSIVMTDNTPGSNIQVTTNASTVLPGSTFTVTGTNPKTATLCWTGNTAMLPATMFIQAGDGACPIENIISTFINAQPCSALPVELLSFEANPAPSGVITQWTTASEQNSDHFTIERSADRSEFKPIGTVGAAGNSQHVRDYSFIDRAPLTGTSYYRLRETDVDGTISLSKVVAVDFVPPARINATWDGMGTWTVTGTQTTAQWTLVDMLGRTVAEGSFNDMSIGSITGVKNTELHVLMVRQGDHVQVLKLPADLPAGAVIGSYRDL